METHQQTNLQQFLKKELHPLVTSIDQKNHYPTDLLKQLGKNGFYTSKTINEVISILDEIGKFCGSTSFSAWCHYASMMYINRSNNLFLKENILPLLQNGEKLGGTGLSNPMKYYAGLEPLRLKATKTENGYLLNGTLPYVSNLGPDHLFAIIAETNEDKRIMAYLSCDIEGLTMVEPVDFIGLNGTGTYTCKFNNVHITNNWIISDDADKYVKQIRGEFVLYQIGMAIGLIKSAIKCINKQKDKQNGVNQYLPLQASDIESRLLPLIAEVTQISESKDHEQHWRRIIELRLAGSELGLEVTQAEMLHCGAAGYFSSSEASRRLRESYFVACVTPATKHLRKMLAKL
jgi:alkylation response protein AidB-like acyl-CoA dehydrogenase